MTKLNRAFEMFTVEGGKDLPKKEFIALLQKEFNITASNAAVYAFKCRKKLEAGDTVKPAKEPKAPKAKVEKAVEAADIAPTAEAPELEEVAGAAEPTAKEVESPVITDEIPDCVPEFLLNTEEKARRAKQKETKSA